MSLPIKKTTSSRPRRTVSLHGFCNLLALLVMVVLPASARPQPLEGRTPEAPPSFSGQTITCLFSESAFDYELLCQLMTTHLERVLPGRYEFQATDRVETGAPLSGSMDILDAIGKLGADESNDSGSFYGFAQTDVAYYFANGGHRLYPTSHHRRGEVVSLARAYREVLHIYSEGEDGGQDFAEALNAWDELFLGALGSGTLITSLNLLSIYQLGPTELRDLLLSQDHLDAGLAKAPLGNSWGGMVVAGIGDPTLEKHIASGRGRLISLTSAQRRHLENAFSQFYSTKTIDAYGQKDLAFLEIPALLVASKRLPEEVAVALRDLLLALDEPENRGRAHYNELLAAAELRFGKPDSLQAAEAVLAGIERHSGERKEGFVLSPHRAILELRNDWGHWELSILLVAGVLAFFLIRRLARDLRRRSSILELSPAVTGIAAAVFSIGWIHLCLFVVSRLEYLCFMRYDTDVASPFIRNTYPELLPMVMQYIASAFSSENLFPLDRSAQLVWLSIPVLIGISGVAGIVHLGLPPVLNFIRTNLDKGAVMKLEDHYVIVNWHPHAQDVVAQLRVQEQMAKGSDPTIVVLTRSAEEVTLPRLGKRKSDAVGEHFLYGLPPQDSDDADSVVLTVVGLEGDPETETGLRMLAPQRAHAVILFPDSSHPEPDSATVLTVLRLQEILGSSSEVKVLVWCADAANVGIFQDPRFRLTDACSTEWAWRVLCQATRVGHVSTIYRHLLTSSKDSNEFYEYCLPEGWTGTFAEAQEVVRRYNEESCDVIDSEGGRRNTILLVGYFEASDHRRERVQINPPPTSEVKVGDALVFLTYVYDLQVIDKLNALFQAHEQEPVAS